MRFSPLQNRSAAAVCCCALAMACCVDADGAELSAAPRKPWTTSRVIGSPEPPPPYEVVRAFPNLKFNKPVLFARAASTNRLFIGEQAGVLYSFLNRPDAQPELFFDLRKELQTVHLHGGAKEVEAVYGLAFHPDFKRNRTCFICYTLRSSDPRNRNLEDGTRVSRFQVTEMEPPRIDPASEEILLTFLQGGHNGGDLHFGPDGMLYISTGDAADPNPPDPRSTGQDLSDLLSSIVRIDVDRRDSGKNYAIPRDNPFVALAGARPEIWAYGFRNPWRMSFDRKTGELLVGDVGWELWEMVYRIEKGGNYGWSATEGPQPLRADQVGPTPIHPALIELPHTIACSVTGGYVYRGSKFPELYGAYIFGDWETRRLWAARFAGDRTVEMPEIASPSVRIVSFGEDDTGELYFLDHDQGTVHTLERADAKTRNADFPRTLSETGLFTSVSQQTPAQGVAPFWVNARQWQDGATAQHWIALPGDSSVTYHPQGKPIPGLVSWHNFRMHFPPNAVLVRTLSLRGQPIETQLLHYDGGDWRPYTYAWRNDHSDADLVPAEGAEKELTREGKPFRWQFHSRSQCLSCHGNQTEYALAFLPEQLNRDRPDGLNQLEALTADGTIRRLGKGEEILPPLDRDSAAREPRLADPEDESQPLAARARGYLHANCNHCHCEGGGGSVPLRLGFSLPLAETKAVGARPTRGDFGLADAAVIKPGSPYASTLYFRMAKFGRDRMPHIGSDQPDEFGLQLIESWIAGLEADASVKSPSPAESSSGSQQPDTKSLENPAVAISFARQLGRDQLSDDQKARLLSTAARLPPGPPRELFEGYLPPSARRTLGASPRPGAILAHPGNAAKGEKMFWSQTLNCSKCHRLGERGTAIGPDLTTIGSQRTREELLESLLTPSLRIEPRYASYVVQTVDGRSLTGILTSRDATALTLQDGEGKPVRVPQDEVEQIRPIRVSLMPDRQMAELTAQEAADLLAFLASCKAAAAPSP